MYKGPEILIDIGLKKQYWKQRLQNFQMISNLEFYTLPNDEPEYG